MKQIPLTQGKTALVDDEDYDFLMQWKWTFSNGYAYRLKTINGKGKKFWLHRMVNKTPDGLFTDHINGNRLDCRKGNLRDCTYSQNNKNAATRKDNKSGFRGVYWEKGMKAWRCVIQSNGKRETLGFYENPEEAAIVYNENASRLHGEFARLNKIGGISSK